MSLEITHELMEGQMRVGDYSENVRKLEVVLLNNHSKTYHPGQYVQGHVVVDVKQSFSTRGIMIQFCGRAGVYWTEKQRGAQDKCIGIVEHEADEEYFNIKNFIFKPGLLPADVHELPFKFQLEPPLPENYEDNVCKIEYFVEARLKLNSNITNDLWDRQDFQVLDPIDLNQLILPDVTLPVNSQKTHTFCCWCCTSAPLIAFLRLPRSGFSPGETIHIQADIENNTSRSINSVKFTLYQERGYRTKHKFHKHRDVICETDGGSVEAKTTREWPDIPLQIPRLQLFNVTASRIFGIRYMLEMEVTPGGMSKSKLAVPLEVFLGSIPLTSVSLATQPHSRLQPNKKEQEKRERAKDIEIRNRNGYWTNSGTLEKNSRQRREDRNRKQVYPDDLVDTSDYNETIHSRDH